MVGINHKKGIPQTELADCFGPNYEMKEIEPLLKLNKINHLMTGNLVIHLLSLGSMTP